MSLMKLLSVSRSFVNGGNHSGRYRMVEQGLLPKFAPVGRPISLAPKKSPENAQARATGPAVEFADCPHPAANADAALAFEAAPAPFILPLGAAAGATAKAADPVCVNAVPASTNWFRMRKNPFTPRPATTVPAVRPIQAELSLEGVKPVRNDLSDADLEVVRAPRELGASAAGPAKPTRARGFAAGKTGLAWSRLTARWFSSERARV